MEIASVNASGGVNGHQIKLITADTKSVIPNGATVAKQLLGQGAQMLVVSCDYDFGSPAAGVAQAAGKVSSKQVNCILIWMDGGPTHYETFDPKPDAPKEIRGEFSPIATAVPGVQFCEVVPNLAKAANKLTIIRSICHKDPNHGGGNEC